MKSLEFPLAGQDARDSGSGGPLASNHYPMLEIKRGRTAHPMRPVQTHRFLIGSSPRCDLCLGGNDIPALHAMIYVDGADLWLEAMSASPAIEINGKAETSVCLSNLDHIRIGAFELVAHIPMGIAVSAAPSVVDVSDVKTRNEVAAGEETELSAAELVEQIEAATQLVNEFERRERLGMEALLDAIERHEPARPSVDSTATGVISLESASGAVDEFAGADLETLVVQLSGVVAELEKRSGVQWRREAGYLNAVSTLFDTQDRLSRQLEILLRRVESLNAERAAREPGRAIA